MIRYVKWLVTALAVVAIIVGWRVVFKPTPVKIDASPAVANYQLCCATSSAQVLCVDKAGVQIDAPSDVILQQLSLCDSDKNPQDKADFSRHQILTPADLEAVSTCCLADAGQKRCQLFNGSVFSMPLAADETALERCSL